MPVQKLNLRPKGLYTNVNQLGTVPEGAISDCENAVLSRPNVLGVRRGRPTSAFFASKYNNQWTPDSQPLREFNAKLRVGGSLSNNFLGETVAGIITMMEDGTMFWSPDGVTYTKVQPTYGYDVINMSPTTGARHFYGFENGGAFYIATASGVVRVARPLPNFVYSNFRAALTPEQVADVSRSGYALAGVPPGLNTTATLGPTGTAINADSQVAYRFCFGFRDANNQVRLGAPSARAVVINPSGKVTVNGLLNTVIPPNINPNRHFWQLYRSLASSSQNVDPGDDCGLVAEGSIPADIQVNQIARTAGTVTVRTATPHTTPVAGPFPALLLKSDIVVQSSNNTDEFYVDKGAGTLRRVYRRVGNAATWTQTATFNVTSEAGAGDPIVAMFLRDNLKQQMFYMEAGTNTITVISNTGTIAATLTIGISGYVFDQAFNDPVSGNIVVIGRNWALNAGGIGYKGSFLVARINPTNGQPVSQVPCNGLVTSQPDISPIAMQTGKLGVWRANRSTPTNLCLALGGLDPYIAVSANGGSTWTFQPLPTATSVDGDPSTTDIQAFDCWENPNTLETVFMIGSRLNVIATGGDPGGTYYDLHFHSVENSGSDTPKLLKAATSLSYNGEFNLVRVAPPAIIALRCHRLDGTIAATYHYTVGQDTQIKWNFGGFSPATKYRPGAAGTWSSPANPLANPGGFDLKVSGGAIADGVGLSGGNAQFLCAFRYRIVGDPTALYHTEVWNCQVPPAASPTLAQLQVDYVTGQLLAVTSVTGPASTASAVIPKGVYQMLTAVDSTHYTFSAPQTPNVDIVATTIDAYLAATEVSYTDVTAPEFLGPYLYTSPSVEGMINANFQPPICRDVNLFRTTAFYANATQRNTLTITMLKLPTIGERIYLGPAGTLFLTAAAAENVQSLSFQVFTAGTLTENIKNTLLSIARVVNVNYRTTGTLIFPIGVGPTSFSTMFLTSVTPSVPITFKYMNSTGTALVNNTFTPNNITGEAVREKNVIYYSKPNQPDAVPLTNSLRIGSDNKEILRIAPSRDALFVLKEDGCFIVRGYGAPWQVDPFDLTLQLSIVDSVATLDNAIFGAFKRGVFKVTDSNAELLSLPIQDQLESLLIGAQQPETNDNGFACGDNADHKYLFFTTGNTFVYDSFTNEWTKWDNNSIYHAISYKEESLLFASKIYCQGTSPTDYASNYYPAILRENKALDNQDFFEDWAYRFPSVKPTDNARVVKIIDYDPVALTVTLADSANGGVDVGRYDVITLPNYPPGTQSAIEPIEYGSAGEPFRVTTAPNFLLPGPQSTDAWVYRGIRHSWKFVQTFPESPAATNHFAEFAVSFRQVYFAALRALFSLPAQHQDPKSNQTQVQFYGYKHFGKDRNPSNNNFIRTYIPRQSQRGTTLTCGIETGACGSDIETNGITLIFTQGPTSFQRR